MWTQSLFGRKYANIVHYEL